MQKNEIKILLFNAYKTLKNQINELIRLGKKITMLTILMRTITISEKFGKVLKN